MVVPPIWKSFNYEFLELKSFVVIVADVRIVRIARQNRVDIMLVSVD